MKLGLGTVQFGLNYGINNHHGKPRFAEAKRIIDCAQRNQIQIVDTAADYGDSEEILGKAIPKKNNFQIVTKLSKENTGKISIRRSLKRLNHNQIYGVLIHDFDQFKTSPANWEEMKYAKNEGLVEKIGFSIYLPEQLEILIDRQIGFDIIQIPYSIFDRRFQTYFQWLKDNNITIHTRSVFVQGLVFTDLQNLSSFFDPMKEKLEALASLSEKSCKSIESLCLNFVYANQYIDNIIIGVDTVQNLESNIAVLREPITPEERQILEPLKEDNELMILPFNWKL